MKRMLVGLVVGLITAMAASAATVPESLKSKVASDDQLASVCGGSTTVGGQSYSITFPSVTFKSVTYGGKTWTAHMPSVVITPPATPIVAVTPVVVHVGSTWTITFPSVTITQPATKIIVPVIPNPIITHT